MFTAKTSADAVKDASLASQLKEMRTRYTKASAKCRLKCLRGRLRCLRGRLKCLRGRLKCLQGRLKWLRGRLRTGSSACGRLLHPSSIPSAARPLVPQDIPRGDQRTQGRALLLACTPCGVNELFFNSPPKIRLSILPDLNLTQHDFWPGQFTQ